MLAWKSEGWKVRTSCVYVLDRFVPFRTVRCRRRPSDPWFDEECRAAKRLTRRLKRVARRADTCNAAAAAAATSEWRTQCRVYCDLRNQKRESWREKVESERSHPQQLWKSIDALLGRGHVPPSHDIGAETFHQFFDAKVAGVRVSTTDALSPSFTSVSPEYQLSDFRPRCRAVRRRTGGRRQRWVVLWPASAYSDRMREPWNSALAGQAFFSGFTGVSHFICDLRWAACAEELTVNMHVVHNFTVVIS